MRKKSWPINASLSKFLFFLKTKINSAPPSEIDVGWFPWNQTFFEDSLTRTCVWRLFLHFWFPSLNEWISVQAQCVAARVCVCVCVCPATKRRNKSFGRPQDSHAVPQPPPSKITDFVENFSFFSNQFTRTLPWLRSHFYRMFWLIFPFFNIFLSQFLRIFGR